MRCSQSAAQQETVIGISWQLQAHRKAGLVPVNEDSRIFVPRGNV